MLTVSDKAKREHVLKRLKSTKHNETICLAGWEVEILLMLIAEMGVGNVNRGLRKTDSDGVPNWKKALYGKTGEAAEKALVMAGMQKKHKEAVKKSMNRRRIRKVTA